ncbi:MAG: glycosyltransferase family 4 protein [Anaerolineales bacterium]|nr:glycosyltransferase family 4 protein [Anaerolineales bacterium]
MHIGLIIYGTLDTVSGGYLYDRKLVAHLRAAGESVEIVSLPWTNYGRHLAHNWSRALRKRVENGRFDLLLQDELNHPSLFWLNRRLRGQVPLVSIVHHLRCSEARPVWQNWLYRQVERRYLASVDSFVFNSETTRKVTKALAGEKRPFVVATPAGDRFNPATTPADVAAKAQQTAPLQLLFVGNLIPRKGLHTLLDALATMPRSDWRLAVVGETAVSPAYTAHIQHQIARHNLANSITLHGPLPDAALADQFARSHLLVVPSSYEGFGIVYLEAMAFGLPAIGTTAGAANEIIHDGDNGLLIAPDDADTLAQRLTALHQNRDLLTRLSLSALSHSHRWPTWGESMAKIHRFLLAFDQAQGSRGAGGQG